MKAIDQSDVYLSAAFGLVREFKFIGLAVLAFTQATSLFIYYMCIEFGSDYVRDLIDFISLKSWLVVLSIEIWAITGLFISAADLDDGAEQNPQMLADMTGAKVARGDVFDKRYSLTKRLEVQCGRSSSSEIRNATNHLVALLGGRSDLTPGKLGVFGVASGVQSEGKTTTALGLAVAAARLGYTAAILDADLRARSSPYSNVIEKLKVSEGDVALPEPWRINRCNCKDVSVDVVTDDYEATNGSRINNLLSINKIIDLTSSRYDLVVVDFPPRLVFPDSAFCVTSIDKWVYVSRHHWVDRPVVEAGAQFLKEDGAEISLAVLTMIRPLKARYAPDYPSVYGLLRPIRFKDLYYPDEDDEE
ncbi:tyrosine-protein kinase family protein [Pseudoroseicyclus sp. H15]